jgi:uncharacterized SAM-binding protein YcdF (DUF218 family)
MRRLLKVFLYILILAVTVYGSSLIYILSLSHKPNIPQHADAALVLGAKVNLDNSPSVALYKRTLSAADLYNRGIVDYIIVTGGVGLGAAAESEIATQVAVQNGVPIDRIIAEDDSHNTYDNIGGIKEAARSKNIHSVVVTSDRFHVARGVLVAKHFGFDPVYWEYPKENYYTTEETEWNYAREALAIIVYLPRLLK